MKNYVLTLAAAGLMALPVAALAADDTANGAAGGEAMASSSASMEHQLADGTTVVVDGDNAYVVGADGSKTPAPDGTHTFTDGVSITVKDGKVVQ